MTSTTTIELDLDVSDAGADDELPVLDGVVLAIDGVPVAGVCTLCGCSAPS